MIRTVVGIVVLILAVQGAPHGISSDRVASFDDAYVSYESDHDRWIIGNDAVTYSLRIARQTVVFEGLFTAGSDVVWTLSTAPDALVTIGGVTTRLGEPGSPFSIDSVNAASGSHFVSLALQFTSEVHHVRATRYYVVYPGAAVVEMWTELATDDDVSRAVENLNAYSLTVPIGRLDWTTGLETPAEEGGSFTRKARALTPGEHVELGSTVLSSLATVPYFSIGNGDRRFITGLIWSGGWRATLDAHDKGVNIDVGLPDMSAIATPDRSVEGPHAFVGVVFDKPGADIAAVTRMVYASRAGREFPAHTTFNTWFLHGTGINEDLVKADIDLAASIGVEQLQVDAGWYPGAHGDAPFDFTTGLGSWEVDFTRFPSGLAALREYAHNNTVRMGVWVEPERVDLQTVGRDGLARERFLAQQDGQYQPGVPNEEATDGQICLADREAREWLLTRLTQFIDEVQPDNLKWDFNRWVICTRPDHGHPVNGGNYEHTRGLYEILAAIRQRYPSLTIENCSGGGHRIDFAMARLTDSAWMDDRTAPSSHVRYNLQGLLSAFPAPYLFSYVMGNFEEPIQGNLDIPLLVRSRMPGIVGITTDLGALGEREVNELHQEFEFAKRLRTMQAGAVTYTHTPQTRDDGAWHVIEQASPASGVIVLYAINQNAQDGVRIHLRAAQPGTSYEVRSPERGRLGVVRGAQLIEEGYDIAPATESAAQVLVFEPVNGPGRVK